MPVADATDDGEPAAETDRHDVLVIGGGVAGLTAALFTARAELNTVVVDGGDSILARNAHLENFPGFPAGVNSLTFLDMLDAQAQRNGVQFRVGTVESLDRARMSGDPNDQRTSGDDHRGFVASLADGTEVRAHRAIAASWSDLEYLEELGVEVRTAGSKQFIQPDGSGRTAVEGLYAAGRLTEQYHQAIVSAGHGAQVAITLIHDSSTPFYHDWVAPEGYFTDRGREIPPGCEEIDDTERRARERESIATMGEYFDEPHPGKQRTYPSLRTE